MIEYAEKVKRVEENYLKRILDYFLLRTRLDYGYGEIFHYLFRCRCWGLKKNTKSELDQNHVLYKRGNDKLSRELDVINLVKSIR